MMQNVFGNMELKGESTIESTIAKGNRTIRLHFSPEQEARHVVEVEFSGGGMEEGGGGDLFRGLMKVARRLYDMGMGVEFLATDSNRPVAAEGTLKAGSRGAKERWEGYDKLLRKVGFKQESAPAGPDDLMGKYVYRPKAKEAARTDESTKAQREEAQGPAPAEAEGGPGAQGAEGQPGRPGQGATAPAGAGAAEQAVPGAERVTAGPGQPEQPGQPPPEPAGGGAQPVPAGRPGAEPGAPAGRQGAGAGAQPTGAGRPGAQLTPLEDQVVSMVNQGMSFADIASYYQDEYTPVQIEKIANGAFDKLGRPPEPERLFPELTQREEDVLVLRVAMGQDLHVIGEQFGVSKQRIQQIEKKGLLKKGIERSIDDIVDDDVKLQNLVENIAQGPVEYPEDSGLREAHRDASSRTGRVERKLTGLVNAMAEEAKHGKLTPESEAKYLAEIAGCHAELDDTGPKKKGKPTKAGPGARAPAGAAAAEGAAGVEAPVRPAAGYELPEGGGASQAAAAEQGPGQAAAAGAQATAAPGVPEAAGGKLKGFLGESGQGDPFWPITLGRWLWSRFGENPPKDLDQVEVRHDPEERHHDLLVNGESKGLLTLDRPKAAGIEVRAANKIFPGIVQEGETVCRLSGIEVEKDARGQGLGQLLLLKGLVQNGADWVYNSQQSRSATNAIKALGRKGFLELHWEKEPGPNEKSGILLARVTPEGRNVAQGGPPSPATPVPPGQGPIGALVNFLVGESGLGNAFWPSAVWDEVVGRASRGWQVSQEVAAKVGYSLREFAQEMGPRTIALSRTVGDYLAKLNSAQGWADMLHGDMVMRVMGPNQPEAKKVLFGNAFVEERFRYAEAGWLDQSRQQSAIAAAAKQLARTPGITPEEKAQHLQQARQAQRNATKALDHYQYFKDRTVLGKRNSAIANQAEYQAVLANPEYQSATGAARNNGNWGIHMVPVMEEALRRERGMSPDDPIDSFTQIPGRAMNMRAYQEGDALPPTAVIIQDVPTSAPIKPIRPGQVGSPAEPELGGAPVGTGSVNPLKNQRLRKDPFDNVFKGNAYAYDIDLGNIIGNTLRTRLVGAARAEYVRAASGVSPFGPVQPVGEWGPPGGKRGEGVVGPELTKAFEIPNVKPPEGSQAAAKGETSFFFWDKGAFDEAYKALNLGKTSELTNASNLVLGVYNRFNLAGVAEGLTHVKNLGKVVWADPVHNIPRIWDYTSKVLSHDPAVRADVLDLARRGMMKTFSTLEGAKGQGLFGGGPWDLTRYATQALDVIQQAARLTARDTFYDLVKRGLKVNAESDLRDFVQGMTGNYYRGAQGDLVRFLKDSGIGPYAVANTTFLTQGIRAWTGGTGGRAPNWQADLRLRGEMFLRAVVGGAVVASIWNYLRWGQAFPQGTKLSDIKLYETDEGKPKVFSLWGLTGAERGAKPTSVDAIMTSIRKGETLPQFFDRYRTDLERTAMMPFEGPGVSFFHTAATGEGSFGQRLSPKWTKPQLQTHSQSLSDFTAAMAHANPTYAALFAGGSFPKFTPAGELKRNQYWKWSEVFGGLGPRERSLK